MSFSFLASVSYRKQGCVRYILQGLTLKFVSRLPILQQREITGHIFKKDLPLETEQKQTLGHQLLLLNPIVGIFLCFRIVVLLQDTTFYLCYFLLLLVEIPLNRCTHSVFSFKNYAGCKRLKTIYQCNFITDYYTHVRDRGDRDRGDRDR